MRATTEALLGQPFPADLADVTVTLVATGRATPPPALADRLPQFG